MFFVLFWLFLYNIKQIIIVFIVEDCKKRWKNVRDSYNRNKRKLGTGSERSLRKKWPLAAHVSFLDKVQHERR